MHKAAAGESREERVRQSKLAGIQKEDSSISYNSKNNTSVKPGSVYDYSSYLPIGNAVQKLTNWKNQGATICYLTSRRTKQEITTVSNMLKRFNFPDSQNLSFRQQGEDYKDVAERQRPDVLVEDDCESIGDEKEMVYPHIKPEFKKKIKLVVVKEFAGIDNLPDNPEKL